MHCVEIRRQEKQGIKKLALIVMGLQVRGQPVIQKYLEMKFPIRLPS